MDTDIPILRESENMMEEPDKSSDLHLGDDYLEFQSHQLWATAVDGSLLSGSMSELPLQYYFTNKTDMDQMFFKFGCCAVSADDPPPGDFYKTVYTIDCNTGHPGFTRLRLGRHYLRQSEFMLMNWPMNGPANKGELVLCERSARPIQSHLGVEAKLSIDIVNCVFCPYWPVQAGEWVTRPRHRGWPSAEVIEDVLKGGCHVVAKSHPSSSDDTELRFSFSRAETVLINSWNAEQKYVYHIIRLLKKDLHDECCLSGHKSVVCTYFLKTLMLWACEEQPAAFWDERNLEESIGELICQLIQWLIDKQCPNYFIRENNMMGDFPETTDFDQEIQILLRIREQEIRKRMTGIRKFTPNAKITIQISNRLFLVMHLALSGYCCTVHPIKYQWSQRFNQSKPRNCHIAALEFGNLYRGVARHLQLASGDTENESILDRLKMTIEAEQYLYVAFSEDAKGDSSITVRLDDTILDFIDSGLFDQISKIPDTEHSGAISSSDSNSHIDRLIKNCDNRSVILGDQKLKDGCATVQNKTDNIVESGQTSSELTISRNCHQQNPDEIAAANTLRYLFLYADHQLELKASYFASAAYLANFYYTLHRDYRRSLDICDAALKKIDRFHNIVGRESFYINLCAVVLSSKWMPMFDTRIQTVFGFAVLFNYVDWEQMSVIRQTVDTEMVPPPGAVSYAFCNSWSTPPPVILRLIPIHFIKYLAFQCRRQLEPDRERGTEEHIFSEDPRSCILDAAIRIPLKESHSTVWLIKAQYPNR